MLVEMDKGAEVDHDPSRQESLLRILDSAERLFRHYGYSKTNVADIARDIGMSPSNIYRFFKSKVEIHQAICGRMLDSSYEEALKIAHLPLTATERLRRYVMQRHQMTTDTMLVDQKVHEMVVVAIERDWHVIEQHIDRMNDLAADIIRQGIEGNEFPEQDPVLAARCFGAATTVLCHPQLVAQCLSKENRATAEQLVEFALKSLKK